MTWAIVRVRKNAQTTCDFFCTDLIFFYYRFPKPQNEAWFLILGSIEDMDMLALKRVNTVRGAIDSKQKLTFWTPEEPGRVILTLYVMSDTYLSLDQQYDLHLEVV